MVEVRLLIKQKLWRTGKQDFVCCINVLKYIMANKYNHRKYNKLPEQWVWTVQDSRLVSIPPVDEILSKKAAEWLLDQ